MSKLTILLSALLISQAIFASDMSAAAVTKKIMVVEFELRDVSPIPNVVQEVDRTILIDTVIKKTLAENGYAIVPACDALKKAYELGNGYLYDRPELAGKLGGECGAD